MLDFYADWCVSCIEMEKFTFSDHGVAAQMSQLLLVQADVTKSTDDDRALLKRFTRSEEHKSELQSLMRTSSALFCFQHTPTTHPRLPRITKPRHTTAAFHSTHHPSL